MSTVQQSNGVLYTALELSNTSRKLGFSNGSTMRERNIRARDRAALLREVARAVDVAAQERGRRPSSLLWSLQVKKLLCRVLSIWR